MFLTSVSAAVEVETADLTIPVNYEDLREDEEELPVSRGITITNTGDQEEEITISLQLSDSDYKLTVEPTKFTLSAGGSQDVTVSGKVPNSADGGINNIGTLTVSGNTHTLRTNVKEMIEVRKITALVNGHEEKIINDDKEELKDLEPLDLVQLRFQLKNLFDEDYKEGDIDGEIKLDLDASSFGEDIDEEESFKLDAGQRIDRDEDEIVLEFRIPQEVEEGDYKLNIKVNGEDETNANYEIEWELELKVERQRNDVRINSLSILPEETTCSSNVKMSAEVTNFGSDRQRDAVLTLYNEALGIDENFEFELDPGTDSDNSITKQLSFTVPKDVNPGMYPIEAISFYDNTKLSDRELINLVVTSCNDNKKNESENQPEEEEEKEEEMDQIQATVAKSQNDNINTVDRISTSAIVKTVETAPYTTYDYTVAVLIITIVFVLALIIIFFIMLLK